jgi:hypothetical protein
MRCLALARLIHSGRRVAKFLAGSNIFILARPQSTTYTTSIVAYTTSIVAPAALLPVPLPGGGGRQQLDILVGGLGRTYGLYTNLVSYGTPRHAQHGTKRKHPLLAPWLSERWLVCLYGSETRCFIRPLEYHLSVFLLLRQIHRVIDTGD